MEKRYKRRIRLVIEKVPYFPKQKQRQKTKYERLFDEAVALKGSILTDKKMYRHKMVSSRTEYIFHSETFKTLVGIGKRIHAKEVFCKSGFVLSFCLIASLLLFISAISGTFAYLLVLPATVLILANIWRAIIPFNRFYVEAFLPICYHIANVMDRRDELNFKVSDRKKSWANHQTNREIITNRFTIRTADNETVVDRMIIRNILNYYMMQNGKLLIAKKLATVFSGYSFDMRVKGYPDDANISLAAINHSTFYRNTGISDDERERMSVKKLRSRHLEDKWSLYVDDGFELPLKTQDAIEKKMVSLQREIGNFNLYVGKGGIRLMLGIQSNREGIQVDFFEASLKDTRVFGYDGLFSIVKALYVMSSMEHIMWLVFGRPTKRVKWLADRSSAVKRKRRFLLPKLESPRNLTKKEGVVMNRNRLNRRGAAAPLSIAIGLIITVVLCGLFFVTFTQLLNNKYSKGSVNKIGQTYSEPAVSGTPDTQSNTIKYSLS